MNTTIKMALFLLCTCLFMGCAKSPLEDNSVVELDWSRQSSLTLGDVAMASTLGTKANDPLMASGQTFRLYALNPKTKEIIATRTYTIDATTAGKPVADDGLAADILLPYGTVDIFLVGPVQATVSGRTEEIATEKKVNPMPGVDLISSRTSVLVATPKTVITAAPLEHRMVKFEIEVKMSKDVEDKKSIYVNASLERAQHAVVISNMGENGVFTFDDKGGTVSSTVGEQVFYRYTYAVGNTGDRMVVQSDAGVEVLGERTGAVYVVRDYMLPSVSTIPKLAVTFGYSLRLKDGAYKEVQDHELSGKTAIAQAWAPGTSIKMTTTLIPSVDLTIRTQISPWVDGGTMPEEPVSNKDLVFWYSGADGPETIDGKLCWRDRSGNGNHAQIIGDMRYDKATQCYYAGAKDVYFKVPKLGNIGAYTLELAAQTRYDAQNRVVNFGGDAGISINLPVQSTINWVSRNSQIVSINYGLDKYVYNQINSYAFARWYSGGNAILVNGQKREITGGAFPQGSEYLDGDNRLWGGTVDPNYPERAGVGTHRIYEARMYKDNLDTELGRAILAKNHADMLSRVGVNAPLAGNTFDYVKEGLILDLRGANALDGTFWRDQSGQGNDATSEGVTHDAVNKHYKGSFSFAKSLGTYKDLTIEFVGRFSGTQSGTHLFIQFKPRQYMSDNYLYRTSIYYLDFKYGFLWEAPYAPYKDTHGDNLRVIIPAADLVNAPEVLSQFSCTRKGAKLYVNHNGYSYTSFVKDVSPIAESELSNGYLGNSNMEVYAVRIYGRTLSDFERQHNYMLDKQTYNILP